MKLVPDATFTPTHFIEVRACWSHVMSHLVAWAHVITDVTAVQFTMSVCGIVSYLPTYLLPSFLQLSGEEEDLRRRVAAVEAAEQEAAKASVPPPSDSGKPGGGVRGVGVTECNPLNHYDAC
jgi:hypothetical protein